MSRLVSLFALVLFMTVAARSTVRAHGGGPGLDYEPCSRWTDADNYVHFSAYQPQFNRFAEYCRSIPGSGDTLLVFDLMGAELTGEPIGIKIESRGRDQFSLPPRLYPSGVVNVTMPMNQGAYTATLTIGSAPDIHRVDFDIKVGAWWDALLAPLVLIGLLLGTALAYCLLQARRLEANTARTSNR